MFEVGDRVQVNLGANGTRKGEVIKVVRHPHTSQVSFTISVDNGATVTIDPWDMFLLSDIEEETE